MDGRVRVNGALFTTDYEDLQVQVFNSVALTQNIGEASIEDLSWKWASPETVEGSELILAGC